MGHHRLAIFTGGTAWNSLVSMTSSITSDFLYVIPVSDNGGSSSEIIRAFGGPGIGDLRSRLIRLADVSSDAKCAVRDLLAYRLPSDSDQAKDEWLAIINGTHVLWNGVHGPFRANIRSFLVEFHRRLECLVSDDLFTPMQMITDVDTHLLYCNSVGACSDTTLDFDLRTGSIGNFYLSSTTQHFQSLEFALEQLSCVSTNGNLLVLPITTSDLQEIPLLHIKRTKSMIEMQPSLPNRGRFNSVRQQGTATKFFTVLDMRRITIAAELVNGDKLYGQCEISHPGRSARESTADAGKETGDFGFFDDNIQVRRTMSPECISKPLSRSAQSFPNLTKLIVKSNLFYSKNHMTPLNASIRRVHYVNQQNQEVVLPLSAAVQNILLDRTTVIYGIGSLYTSLIPCLIVTHIAHAITRISKRIFVLNGTLDRETTGFSAVDFVYAICDALNFSWRVTNQVYGKAGKNGASEFGIGLKAREALCDGMRRYCVWPNQPGVYISHLIYLRDSTIYVDVERIKQMGINCVSVDGADGMYDVDLLGIAIKNILDS